MHAQNELRYFDLATADLGRKIIKTIKDAKLKTQAAMQERKVRVSGKKRDALPREPQTVWFEAKLEGTYQMACAELCGLGHTTMKSKLVVESAEQVAAWLETQKEQ